MTARPVQIGFLGGLGEIGRNCFFVECDGRIVVVDCGLMFPTDDMPGIDLVLPDLTYLTERADAVDAVIVTHGHEDHIGALPYLLRAVDAPVFGSRLALAMIAAKLDRSDTVYSNELVEMVDGEAFEAGQFRVTPIPVTHSTPQAFGLAIETPQGTILHTGDFKLDQTPVDGRTTDLATFGAFGREGVRLLLADSTNAETNGFTESETTVGLWLDRAFDENPSRRVVAACFASHLHRIQQIVDSATKQGRKIAFLGRSMHTNTELARELGVLSVADDVIVPIEEADDLPDDEVCVICTGSQGEPFAALSLMASGDNKLISIGDNDTVIISSTPIPGNESKINRAINGLLRHGARVLHSGIADVHASGHASSRELEIMHTLVRGEFFVPVHGEYRHMHAHAALAERAGTTRDNIFIMMDGALVTLDDDGCHVERDALAAGYVYVDGATVGDVTNGVLRHRRSLAGDGVLVCVVGVDNHTGDVTRGPEIFSRGFLAAVDHEKFSEEAAAVVVASIERAAAGGALDLTTLNRHVREAIARHANEVAGRRPFIFPIVIEV